MTEIEYIPLKTPAGAIAGHARVRGGYAVISLRTPMRAHALILTDTGSAEGTAGARIPLSGQLAAIALHENGTLRCYGFSRASAMNPVELRRRVASLYPAPDPRRPARRDADDAEARPARSPSPDGAKTGERIARTPSPDGAKTGERIARTRASAADVRASAGQPPYSPRSESDAPARTPSPDGAKTGERIARTRASAADVRASAGQPPYSPRSETDAPARTPSPDGVKAGERPDPASDGAPPAAHSDPVTEFFRRLPDESGADETGARDGLPDDASRRALYARAERMFRKLSALSAPVEPVDPLYTPAPVRAGGAGENWAQEADAARDSGRSGTGSPVRAGGAGESQPQQPDAARDSARSGTGSPVRAGGAGESWAQEADVLLSCGADTARTDCAAAPCDAAAVPIANPFPHIFPGAEFVRCTDGSLAGFWRQGDQSSELSAVPGPYSPQPPAHLSGYTRYIRARSGGYWVRVR